MMIATGTNAVLGFVFWIIVARFYPAEDVGLASAAIAATGLLALFSYLGLGAGLIRFLPGSGKDANSMINTAFTVGLLASLLAISIFVAGLGFWSPSLVFLRQDPLYLIVFFIFSIIFTLSQLVDNTLIAGRRANYVLARSLVFGILRLILPVILVVFFDFFGIFSSWGISLVVAFLLSILLFLPRAQPGYRLSFALNRKVLSDMLNFSAANYVAGLLWSAPVMVLPILVVNLLGAELNAYFYIAWSVSSVLAMVPTAASTSLFTEGSHEEENLRPNIWRSLKMVFVILVPAVILVLVLADRLLLLFGSDYSENATTLLRILTASTLPLAVNLIYLGIIRVEKKLKTLICLSIFAAVVTLVLSYVLLPRMGINGAGIAWLASNGGITLWIVAGWIKAITSAV
ncbi:MAG TPA: oligosaccharide flippase family protein [Dehalococcoidia bacterium]|nr:oligosaccharide flippase family protein [Dehalococcoidia bacterium]